MRSKLGFDGSSCCPRKGDELMLLWKQELEVLINGFSHGHIDCFFSITGNVSHLAGFYGNPTRVKKLTSVTY